MKLNCLFILVSILGPLSGCNQSMVRGDLQPAQKSNDVAIANLELGVAYMNEGNYEKALEKLERARQADPGYSPTFNMLGLLYQVLGENAKAEEYFKRAIGLNANDSSTLNNYGRFLCQNGRTDEAEETFLRASKNPLYKTPEIAITNAGTCAMTNDRKEEAEKYFRQALQLNPQMPVPLLQMAMLSFEQGNALSARAYLQRYQEQARHTPGSLWLGIQIERELGDKNALASYTLLLKNGYPESKEAELLKEPEFQKVPEPQNETESQKETELLKVPELQKVPELRKEPEFLKEPEPQAQ